MKNEKLLLLELRISKMLRFGVLLAGAFLMVGWMGTIDLHNSQLLNFQDYHGTPLSERIQVAYSQGQWFTLTSIFGLLLIISLPIIRVFLTAILFFQQKQKIMSGIAFFVLAVLISSFFLGIHI